MVLRRRLNRVPKYYVKGGAWYDRCVASVADPCLAGRHNVVRGSPSGAVSLFPLWQHA